MFPQDSVAEQNLGEKKTQNTIVSALPETLHLAIYNILFCKKILL